MKTRSILLQSTVIVIIGAAVTLGFVRQTRVSKNTRIAANTRIASKVVLVSDTGERIPSFFAGLRPIKGYVNGKMYPKTNSQSGCSTKPNLLDRVAITLGLERLAQAQGGCNFSICNGCYIKIVGGFCSGACYPGSYWQNESGGSTCNAGFTLNGPSCNTDNGCSCNSATCTNSPGNCGC